MKPSKARISYVYLAARGDGFLKIGMSLSPTCRMISLSDRNASGGSAPALDISGLGRTEASAKRKMELLRTAIGGRHEEALIHSMLHEFSVEGCNEWFLDTPKSRRKALRTFAALGRDMRTREEILQVLAIRISASLIRAVRIEAATSRETIRSLVEESLHNHLMSRASRRTTAA